MNNSLFEFPFIAEVWGTVSDWAMVLVTAVTAIFLVKTFKESQRLTRIETERFLYERLPILGLKDIDLTQDHIGWKLSFSIFLESNFLNNLTIEHDFFEPFEVKKPHIMTDVIIPPGHYFDFEVRWPYEPVIPKIVEYSGNLFTFRFQDSMGNKYKQIIFYKGATNLFIEPAIREI